MDDAALRAEMVDGLEHETKRAVTSERVGEAMRTVPRHEFVDADRRAYLDRNFEHCGTRVLAPATAAFVLEALELEPEDSVLIVGVGVGYTAAVAAEIVGARNVCAIDISRKIVYDARENLASAGYEDVLVDCRDGAEGLPAYAPFEKVLLEAAVARPPRALVEQLAPGGRLVFPKGARPTGQTLTAVEDGAETETFGPAAFAPLLVEGEQHGAVERNRTHREDRERATRNSKPGWEQEWIDWEGR
jgi:protein-L-isoaspartate(D-aspartate) O-methyltransferase